MEIKNVANLQTSIKMMESQSVSQQSIKAQNQENDNSQTKIEENVKQLSPHELEKIAKDLKEKLSMLNTQLKIEMEEIGDSEKIPVVKIVDVKTKQVIRQIPPEYMLKVAKYIDEITGILFREKA